jgi:small subunit ribosomal protein S35
LAGPRWTPGPPGRQELESDATSANDEGKEGWIKIAEERFKEGVTNRRSAGEMLERLVEAANVSRAVVVQHL